MTETVTVDVPGINKSVYFSAETLKKLFELGAEDNLSGFIKQAIDEKYERESKESKKKSTTPRKSQKAAV